MKKLLLGSIGLVALAFTGPAVAADFPAYSKAPSAMMPALYDWSGLYIGINGGGGWAHKCWSLDQQRRRPSRARRSRGLP